MWILPRPLHTSDFVPDTAALSLDSTESSEICARSLFVRSKPSPARTWSQKWRRDSWTALLSGRILRPSHGQSFVTAWTSSLVATPASHSVQPAKDSAQKTLGTSGHLSQTEFGFSDPSSASLKMSKDTSASDSAKSLESWEQSVIRRRGEYSLRVKSARLTSASGSSSWPTATSQDGKQGGITPFQAKGGNHTNLLHVAAIKEEQKNWPTIRASEYKDVGPVGSKSHDHMLGKHYLCAVVTQEAANWPTPCAMEAEKAGLFDKGQMGQSLSAMANRGELSNWPTPDASNHRDGAVLRTDNNLEQGGFHGVSLHHAMTKYGQAAPANPSTLGSRQGLSEENWVTPRTSGTSTRPNKTTPRQGLTLIEQARANEWGTPTARDHKSGRGNEEREYKELTPMVERTQSGKLNPRWVETLMGLPVGWTMPSCASPVTTEQTNFASSATESSQQQQNEHSELFGRNSQND